MSTEPWLRGPLADVHPVAAHLIYTFGQAREELAIFTRGLSNEQVWCDVAGGSLGFHLRHIGGSVDRLATYLRGEFLTDAQMAFLKSESVSGPSLDALLQELDAVFLRVIALVTSIDPATYLKYRLVRRLQ